MSHGLSQTGQICTCGMLRCFEGSFQRVETQDEQENSAWWQCMIRTGMALKDDKKVHFLCWSSHLFFFSVSKDRRDWLVEQRHLSKPWMCQNLPFSISLVVKSISFCWLSWSSRQTYACPKNSSGFMWIFWILIENSGVSLISSWGINLTSISMLVYALCSTDRWDVLECKKPSK